MRFGINRKMLMISRVSTGVDMVPALGRLVLGLLLGELLEAFRRPLLLERLEAMRGGGVNSGVRVRGLADRRRVRCGGGADALCSR